MYPPHWKADDINMYNLLKHELERHQQQLRNERLRTRDTLNSDWDVVNGGKADKGPGIGERQLTQSSWSVLQG
jgi:hypothetical protein